MISARAVVVPAVVANERCSSSLTAIMKQLTCGWKMCTNKNQYGGPMHIWALVHLLQGLGDGETFSGRYGRVMSAARCGCSSKENSMIFQETARRKNSGKGFRGSNISHPHPTASPKTFEKIPPHPVPAVFARFALWILFDELSRVPCWGGRKRTRSSER